MCRAKFADDSNVFRMMKTRADDEELQEDFYKLGEWVTMWKPFLVYKIMQGVERRDKEKFFLLS